MVDFIQAIHIILFCTQLVFKNIAAYLGPKRRMKSYFRDRVFSCLFNQADD